MGKKQAPEETNKAGEPEAVEDTPVIKELKEINQKYLELEQEYEKKRQELQKEYTKKQQPFLEKRLEVLQRKGDSEAPSGTPQIPGFWCQAMKHLPALEDQVEEWDEPVLEYLSDIEKQFLDESDLTKGFKLIFKFAENPYFENKELVKEYQTQESSPYTGEIETLEIKATEIEWKEGKNVTVEKVAKKVKGGGAKKAKQKGKEKEEPRDSFFRNFFRNLRPDMELPEDIGEQARAEMCDGDSDDDDEMMLRMFMDNDYEIGNSVREHLIPFAVMWYTGEADPDAFDDDDDDFDDEDEEDEEDDDDDDEEDEEDEKPSGKKKSGGGKGPGGEKAEECKQQ